MNELQLIPNPDNLPNAVTSGYQQQNNNIFTIQTGIDTTEPYDNGNGVITIPAGGIVENNGVMFKIAENVILNKPNIDTAYFVEIIDHGNGNASFGLVTRPGAWNSGKKGCYTQLNRRVLNWVSTGNLDNPSNTSYINHWNLKGTYNVQLPFGFFYIQLRSGLGAMNLDSRNPTKYESFDFIYFNNKTKNKILKIGGNGQSGKISEGWQGFCGGGEATEFENYKTKNTPFGKRNAGNTNSTHRTPFISGTPFNGWRSPTDTLDTLTLEVRPVNNGFGSNGYGNDGGEGMYSLPNIQTSDNTFFTINGRDTTGRNTTFRLFASGVNSVNYNGGAGGDGGSVMLDGTEGGYCEIRSVT